MIVKKPDALTRFILIQWKIQNSDLLLITYFHLVYTPWAMKIFKETRWKKQKNLEKLSQADLLGDADFFLGPLEVSKSDGKDD